VSDDKIEIGLPTTDARGASAAYAALSGVGGAFTGDYTRAGNAVVEYLNARGGMAGREIVPVWHSFNAGNYVTQAGREQEQQGACATWTQDHAVFAVSAAGMNTDVFVQCMADSNTIFVPFAWMANLSRDRVRELHELWYAPHGLMAARRERNLVEGLWEQGFFDDDAKIAMLIEDTPGSRDGVDGGTKPALAAHGLELALEIVYPDQIQSPWPNYILQLQSAGITHVLMSTTTGSIWSTVFAMRSAEDQQYRPRWGIASDNGPSGLLGTQAPRVQLERAQGIGWQPGADIGNLPPQSPPAEVCAQINRDASQPDNTADAYCEVLFFLKTVLDRVDEVSPAGVARAVASLGEGFTSMSTIGGRTAFSDERHDGPAVYHDLVFDEECAEDHACFRYDGATKPIR
jgi:hypothetical protein